MCLGLARPHARACLSELRCMVTKPLCLGVCVAGVLQCRCSQQGVAERGGKQGPATQACGAGPRRGRAVVNHVPARSTWRTHAPPASIGRAGHLPARRRCGARGRGRGRAGGGGAARAEEKAARRGRGGAGGARRAAGRAADAAPAHGGLADGVAGRGRVCGAGRRLRAGPAAARQAAAEGPEGARTAMACARSPATELLSPVFFSVSVRRRISVIICSKVSAWASRLHALYLLTSVHLHNISRLHMSLCSHARHELALLRDGERRSYRGRGRVDILGLCAPGARVRRDARRAGGGDRAAGGHGPVRPSLGQGARVTRDVRCAQVLETNEPQKAMGWSG